MGWTAGPGWDAGHTTAQLGVPTLNIEAGMAHGPLLHSVLRATNVRGGTENPYGYHTPRAHTLPRVQTSPEQKLLHPPARRLAFPQDCSVKA